MTGGRDLERAEVAVIGGGITGLAIAANLAGAGVRVTLCERGTLGGMAMVAFAGILTAGGAGPLGELAGRSARRYRALGAELEARTGIDIELIEVASLEVAGSEDEARTQRAALPELRRLIPSVDWVESKELRRLEPSLSDRLAGATVFSGEAHIRPRAAVAAFAEAALQDGATIRERAEVVAIEQTGGRVSGVRLAHGGVTADVVILAAGAWSGTWGERLGLPIPVTPLRGQLIRLEQRGPLLRHIVYQAGAYVTAKTAGTIAVGATEEAAGFDRRVTAAGVGGLTALASDLVPALADATFLDAWAGLRPVTPDGLPIIGPAPAPEGLYLATGHARNGILLAPATADLVAALVTGRDPGFDPAPFAVSRFAPDTGAVART